MSLDYRQMMQENLDGQLNPEQEEELLHVLETDHEAAEENAKLHRVHHALGNAPHIRAPERLAATIMARLAKSIEEQAQMAPMPLEIKLALMLSMSMVQMIMMPVMMAASYLVLNVMYNPEILSRVMERTIALMVMMIEALIVLLEEVEEMIKRDPKSAPVAMSLIPVALMGMIEYIQEETSFIDNDVA